jgi:CRISPR-associated protein (TIGR03986 family)
VWKHRVSQDVPFREGVSGRLKLTITAHTPILVARDKAKNDRSAQFFQLSDKTYAVPGSALRGMIRNVIEIAAFGAMGMVDDRRLGVRDLTPGARDFYGGKLTEEVSRRVFRPLSEAGWLRLDTSAGTAEWRLTPCEFARVEHDALQEHLRGFSIDPGSRPPAHKIYADWEAARGKFDVDMQVAPAIDHPHQRGSIRVRYRKATFGGRTPGTLVFTGQPGRNKHMEFFFYNRARASVSIPPEVMAAFHSIHEDNEDWKRRWRNVVRRGGEVPMFWLDDGTGQPGKLGLAMMFRLAYDFSIGECIENTNPRHRANDVLDLATLLFGRAAGAETADEGPKEPDGLKGRVSFGLARARGNPQPRQYPDTVLNTPKPTYYPNYVRQPVEPKDRGKLLRDSGYATYTRQSGAAERERPEIRGWKRYPVRPPAEVPTDLPPPPPGSKPDLVSKLNPLPKGTVFEGELRFHNLRPEELGAMLWALEWGGDGNLRHTLGMGKPFGFGQVSIKIDRTDWDQRLITNDMAASPKSFEDYVSAFTTYMDEQYRSKADRHANIDWRQSEQIVQLLAMANPTPAAREFEGQLKPMVLTVQPQRNEFKNAKDARLVLTDYALFSGTRDSALFPRSGATQSGSGSVGRPQRETSVGAGQAKRPGVAPDEQFGFRVGQTVAVGGELGRVTGFEEKNVLIDFGDGPEPIDHEDVELR